MRASRFPFRSMPASIMGVILGHARAVTTREATHVYLNLRLPLTNLPLRLQPRSGPLRCARRLVAATGTLATSLDFQRPLLFTATFGATALTWEAIFGADSEADLKE